MQADAREADPRRLHPGGKSAGSDQDAAIRAIVVRLSRPHASGGNVIERAAILAEGAHAAEIVQWISDHAGQPEGPAPGAARGLHGSRVDDRRSAQGATPVRYVLPAGALA
jgi:hypothetical protein